MISPDSSGRLNRPYFVLVVEDNPDHQLLIGYSLRASMPKAEPVFAATSQEALSYLEECSSGQNPFPRLIFLDIYLPQPEIGWQLLTTLRSLYTSLPVLALSSYQEATIIRRAYELGAHSFVAKPQSLPEWEKYFRVLGQYWLDVVTLPY